MRIFKSILLSALMVLMVFPALNANAYVSVSGYYRSDGTYVAPYVRSNPNGLKYDNYGYKPSQGLYNPSYGTRGASWDTPTWITDPYYYQGKSIYESNDSYYTVPKTPTIPTYIVPKTPTIPTCQRAVKVENNVSVPKNATLSTYGSDWYCDSGYKTKYNSSYEKVGCEKD